MARKKSRKKSSSRRRSRRRGMGAVIRVTSLGRLSDPKSGAGAILPVLLGGGVTVAVTLGIRQMMEPSAVPSEDSNATIIENAPLLGGLAGLVVGGALFAMKMQPAGLAASAGAVVTALGMWGLEKAAEMKAAALVEAATIPGTNGLRAVVPEYGMRGLGSGGRGMGAIVMENQASRGNGAGPLGSYGETVNLGAINPGAFGTPGFKFGR